MKALCGIGILLLAGLLPAQQQAVPAFDALSVKPIQPSQPQYSAPMRGGPGTDDPTRITYPRVSLSGLLKRAYDVRPDQISGPDWLGENLYAVSATMPAGVSAEQFRKMLQNLLAERFGLVLHHVTKEYPGYDLVVAPGGAKIKPFVPLSDEPAPPSMSSRTPKPGHWGLVRSTYIEPVAQFALGLGIAINQSNGTETFAMLPRVADKTGLTGTYQITVEFEGIQIIPNVPPPADAANPGDGGPNIFRAVEEQLGLMLVKTKNVGVDVLVIDRAEKVPTEN
jgi:uncharacterized protein (TIGR03435 family)